MRAPIPLKRRSNFRGASRGKAAKLRIVRCICFAAMSRRRSYVGISPEELASPPQPPLLKASRRTSLLDDSAPDFAEDFTSLRLPNKRSSVQHSLPSFPASPPRTHGPSVIVAQPLGGEAAPQVRGCCPVGAWPGRSRALRLLIAWRRFEPASSSPQIFSTICPLPLPPDPTQPRRGGFGRRALFVLAATIAVSGLLWLLGSAGGSSQAPASRRQPGAAAAAGGGEEGEAGGLKRPRSASRPPAGRVQRLPGGRKV